MNFNSIDHCYRIIYNLNKFDDLLYICCVVKMYHNDRAETILTLFTNDCKIEENYPNNQIGFEIHTVTFERRNCKLVIEMKPVKI